MKYMPTRVWWAFAWLDFLFFVFCFLFLFLFLFYFPPPLYHIRCNKNFVEKKKTNRQGAQENLACVTLAIHRGVGGCVSLAMDYLCSSALPDQQCARAR
jgi:hypothetical protein